MADPQQQSTDNASATSREVRQPSKNEGSSRQNEQTVGNERRSFQDSEDQARQAGQTAAGAARDVARTAADTTRQLGETGRRTGREVAQAWRSALDPFAATQLEVTRWFDEMWRKTAGFSPLSSLHAARPFAGLGAATFFGMPATDIRETQDAYLLAVELPGLALEDVDLSLNGEVLTIRGHKTEDKSQGQGAYRISERRFGQFERSFPMPQDVDRKHVDATFKDGLLTIHLPKTEQAAQQEERVEIRA